MNWAKLDDGREVIVDSARSQWRMVRGEPERIGTKHVTVLLNGTWQVVAKSRLKSSDPAPVVSLA